MTRRTISSEVAGWVGGLVRELDTDNHVDRQVVRLGLDASDGAHDGLVLGCGPVVVKLHARHTDNAALQARLTALQSPVLARLWVQPLSDSVAVAPDGRAATVWPRVEPLDPHAPVPWADVGRLLAALHSVPLGAVGFPHGGHARLRRAVAAVRGLGRSELAWLTDFGEQLLERLSGEAPGTWVHGDFHLGQLARRRDGAGWLMLDVDDLGVGDPVWDLARPAGFWAAGLLDDRAWADFLAAYRVAGGTGVPPVGDPWPTLDLHARAAVLIATSRALRRSPRDFTADSLLATCRQMTECAT